MNKFIKNQLLEDEQIIYEGRLSKVIFLGPVLLSLIIIGIPLLIRKITDYKTTNYIVTNKRIMIKKGLINRTIEEQMISKIETVQASQSFIGSLFKYGSVLITGTGGNQITLDKLNRPFEFKNSIINQMEKIK